MPIQAKQALNTIQQRWLEELPSEKKEEQNHSMPFYDFMKIKIWLSFENLNAVKMCNDGANIPCDSYLREKNLNIFRKKRKILNYTHREC